MTPQLQLRMKLVLSPLLSFCVDFLTLLFDSVPAGEYNQNAVISVIFNSNNGTYLHFNHTFHYGPMFTAVTPPCGNYQGGSYVALTGFNLNDPIVFNTSLPPIDALPTVEVVYGTKRYFGSGVVYDGNSVQFITPPITDQDVFGQDVEVYVHFKGIDSKVTHLPTATFRYGPIVYNAAFPTPGSTNFQNPSPGYGHSAGGDVIAIYGCGFSAFAISQISPLISSTPGNYREFCIRGPSPGSAQDTLVINSCGSSCQSLLCYSSPGDCNSNSSLSKNVEVAFRPSGSNFQSSYTLPPSNESPLTFVLGPQVNTVSSSRGSWSGGQTVTVAGTSFYSNGLTSSASNPGWNIVALFNNPSINYTTSVPVSVISDSQLRFTTPATYFGFDTELTFDFGTSCTSIPRNTSFPYHFGPLCSTISPANGYMTGGKTVTISGLGFLEDGVDSASNINVQLCIDRLNPGGSTCAVAEPLEQSTVQISNTQITLTTPSITSGISTLVGGNRLFGDETGIYITFDAVPRSNLLGNATTATLFCGNYRYGPVVSTLSPDKGPAGPLLYQQPGTRVTITGSAFNDPFYNTNIETAFGSGYSINDGYIFGFNTRISGINSAAQDTTIATQTSYGGNANSNAELSTIFNTCNSTTSNFTVSWGPVIDSISVSNIETSSNSSSADIYGLLPQGGQVVAVFGQGFDEFFALSNNVTTIDALCLIDGVPVTTTTDGSRTIFCATPARDFGSIVNVSVAFGFIGCSQFNDINYRQIITASQKLHYTPIIYDFSPVYGLTSGGTSVTISGEGFANWVSATCYFGHYTEGIPAQVSTDGFSVVCNTPYHRGEFNTDVTVNIIMDFLLDENVIAPYKYHYGPLCTDINPNFGYIAGNISANIIGGNFIDCFDSGSTSPFINCTFTEILVSVNSSTFQNGSLIIPDGISTDNIAFFLPPSPSGCADNAYFGLYFPDVNVSTPGQKYVNCSNTDRSYFYRYGPLAFGASSTFYRANTSYGWQDEAVTITGISLDDPNAGNSSCFFGNVSGQINSLSEGSVVCFAPNGTWNTYVNLNLNYSGGSNNCPLNFSVGRFHYGPVLDSVSPTFGYVAGATPITISGFAFGCCGIDFYQCLMPPTPQDPSYPVISIAGDTVTCNVPHNQDVDVLIENIGVLFESPLFANTSINNLTLTEAGTSLTYYYGPIISGFTPNRASLSGSGSQITISGVGFLDPYFDATVYCDYFSQTKGFSTTTVAGSVSDTDIVCPISPFAHRCGDLDGIRPRWTRFNSTQLLRPELGTNYVKTYVPPTPAPRMVDPFFGDGGSSSQALLGPIYYGPSIISMEVGSGNAPAGSVSGGLISWVSGGLDVIITFDNIQDWVSNAPTKDFGSQRAWCLFGNFASASLSEITLGSNSINCTVPYGVFNYSGPVRVILDPHFDTFTSFIPNVSADWWHWLPYTIGISKTYSGIRGYQSFVVEGAGFCSFGSVVCSFGGVEGVQSDILNDFQVVCQAPPLDAGVYNLQLNFHNTQLADNIIPVTNNWTVAGVVDIQPREGPLCGGTTITVKGYGFNLFKGLACSFNNGRQTAVATYINSNTAVCVTPNLTPHSLVDSVSCNSFDLVGYFPSLGSVSMPSPFSFETGLPRVFASDPSFAYLESSSQIVIAGEYFNGGRVASNGGTYYCKFGNIIVDAIIHTFIDSAFESISTIVCNSPTIYDFPSLTVGTVPLEIKFDCLQGSFTINRLPFEFKQTPDILRYTPTHGGETGGSKITVKGEHLEGGSQYLCSFGTLGIDNQIISAFYDPITTNLTCYSPAHLVTPEGLRVDFAISIDGGKNWLTALTPFEYRNVIIDCEAVNNQNFPTLPKNVNSANSNSFASPLVFVLSLFLSLCFLL